MEIFKKRRIKIPGIDLVHFEGLKKDLIRIEGIHDLSLDVPKQRVSIKYDLEKITFKEILGSIVRSGVYAENGFWQVLKRGLIIYMEQNEKENLHAPAASCCSNPEKILNKAYR